MADYKLIQGDCLEVLKTLEPESVHCCVTSPPYFGLRDYDQEGQVGLEDLPEDYCRTLVAAFREVRRILRDDGTLWLNIGDSYNNRDKWGGGGSNTGKQTVADDGSVPSWQSTRRKKPSIPGVKHKDLIGIPWMVAFALRADGWYLRSDIVWNKPNAMPEPVKDRPTKAHEYIFLLAKNERYYYDAAAIREKNSSNKRTVWEVNTKPLPDAHFATFPPKLITPCVLAGCPVGGSVLDPFSGNGTTGLVALKHGRNYVGIEINPAYVSMSTKRLDQETKQLSLLEGII